MWREFFIVALLSAVANGPVTAEAQPLCPPGNYAPICARDPHEGGSERPPFESDVDPQSRSGHAEITGHSESSRVAGAHAAGAGSHGGRVGSGGGNGGGGGGGSGGDHGGH